LEARGIASLTAQQIDASEPLSTDQMIVIKELFF